MTEKLSLNNEIGNLAKVIRAQEFIYLTSFADTTNRYVDILLKKDGIIRLRWGILSLLITRGGSLTPTELAGLAFRSKHSITKVVDSLQKEGLVIRHRGYKDRRRLRVKITPAGLDFMKQTLTKGEESTRNLMSSLDKDERKILLNLIKKLRQAMIGEILSH